jgi:hypothetical protein
VPRRFRDTRFAEVSFTDCGLGRTGTTRSRESLPVRTRAAGDARSITCNGVPMGTKP